ncbi:MAG: GEVED domain-containing protein [candidate division KSB1 bacterium]|nr:GEVED domain-containing protein [candidate division KSB1 bacterium]
MKIFCRWVISIVLLLTSPVLAQRLQYDYGDAPDSPYPTVLRHSGARHAVNREVFLGKTIDAEEDGQPSPKALGDDNKGDDEDGVSFGTLVPGQVVAVRISASTAGVVNIWLDIDRNGDWKDDYDHVLNNVGVSKGSNTRYFNLPQSAEWGYTFARVRYSLKGGESYTGDSPNGEVEDYYVEIEELEQALDFGDAPDQPYPTLLKSDGARHRINPDVFLGSRIDDERDGQPNANADGDDNAGSDDEDGVSLPSSIHPGQTVNISVSASTNGFLNAWVDFNGDGDWTDSGEQIFNDAGLNSGNNNLSFTARDDSKPGKTCARFRFSLKGGESFKGEASNGEVEDYQIEIYEPEEGDYDFGDAPDEPYPTFLANNGARHLIIERMFLGSHIDGDPDGQPTAAADGDDMDATDDEDGIRFVTALIPGSTAKIEVIASQDGILNAWLDFNHDGDWSDAGEQIIANTPVMHGIQTLSFMVPADAKPVRTYARFRYSKERGLSFTGAAKSGEVEDYHVAISESEQFDWGDAPDQPYPTLQANNGAFHRVVEEWFLGSGIDAEADGQPTLLAHGDDANGSDDEDGVAFPVMTPGNTVQIKVLASRRGILNAWMDFDGDGSWADAGDQIAQDVLFGSGSNLIPVDIPLNATSDSTCARFRFSSSRQLGFTGGAPDGEVEDYRVQFPHEQLHWDFGDLPDSLYRTSLALDGARHRMDTTLYLGARIDTEPDGQPSADATGDDNGGNDDEDGIGFMTPWLPGQYTTIKAEVSGNGILNAWVDWNHNQEWDTAIEHAISNRPVSSGTNHFSFRVPLTALPGETGVRFRLTSYRAVFPWGAARDGEVEDYIIGVSEEEPRMDFGDAPDKPFPTLLKHNGARHVIDTTLFFGSRLDAEPDGLPDAAALGDDNDHTDDEDGISFNAPLIPGTINEVTVTVSMDAIVTAWVDFNGNGLWTDPLEHILVDEPVPQGTQTLQFPVPLQAASDLGYARFRVSRTHGLSFYGPAREGEVEDLTVRIDEPDPETNTDFGDAPEQPYPTTLAQNGARHGVSGRLFLGALIDAEADGQPDLHALGDDNGSLDDEDGVRFTTALLTGHNTELKVIASDSAFLNGWIDFNANGDWSDTLDHVVVNHSVQPGVNYITIAIPADATTDSTYARFRLSYERGIGFTGYVENGEVEDYQIVFQAAESKLDFGDAPDEPYPTLKAHSGACHVVDYRCYLGKDIDPDVDGMPDVNAQGDDTFDSQDDEDGIRFPAALVPGDTSEVMVTASISAYLNAWIDYNQDGDWADAGEHVIVEHLTSAGTQHIPFILPANAAAGSTYARFRLCSDQGLTYKGAARNGEVEDERILIHSLVDPETGATQIIPVDEGTNTLSFHVLPGHPGDTLDLSADSFLMCLWN